MPSLDTAMSYHRLKRSPLDDREVFTNLRDLMDYCKDGARYNGQRVVVMATDGNHQYPIEYCIVDNIPLIDMRGSEPIFKTIGFSGDASATHGMLIYEHNMGEIWRQNQVFCFDEANFCLLNQIEIFRILDAAGNKTFKFYIERTTRGTDTVFTATWNQSYNPYIDGKSNSISVSSGATITKMSYNNTASSTSWLYTNNSDICLMPKNSNAVSAENIYITKIYVKAEDYYQAWIN